jgi:hypothetical protein
MAIVRANGITVATAATDAHAVFGVWNPSGTKRIRLIEFGICAIAAPGAASGFEFRRCSARGTPGTTVTPGVENSDDRDATPDSGWLLDLATYSVQPTLLANSPLPPAWILAAVIGSGIIYPYAGPGITIPPGTGIVCVTRAAIAVPACEISVAVGE